MMAGPGDSAARAFDSFGGTLLQALGGGSGNTVFSPVSIGAALLMALLGARGSTAAQLAAALRLASPAAAGDGLRLLGSAAGEEPTFRDPYTIWVQAGLPVRPEFSRALTGLGAAVRDADFSRAPGQARQEINELIGKQTAGKIPNVLGPGSVTAATRMVLASAVYLKAAWEHPFPARATAGGQFHPGPGRTLTVPLMHLTARMRYLRAAGYQAVVLPYQGGRLAMTVLLPDGQPGQLGPCQDRIAAAGLAGLLAGAQPQRVRLALPRFRQQGGYDLVPVLRGLGVTDAFGGQADFGVISAAERLRLGVVAHSAFIDVDEHGTEAAAATAAVAVAAAMTGGEVIVLTVDRPFLFAITDTGTGLPLFLGRVTEPPPE